MSGTKHPNVDEKESKKFTMKRMIFQNRGARLLALSLALSAGLTVFGATAGAVAAEADQGSSGRFTEKMKDWQEKMSDAFRDTWRGLWRAKSLGLASVSTASVDLREQPESYTLRLNLPERDLNKVEVALEADTLKITAPAEGKAARYEQAITLAGIAPDAKPQIERRQKDNLIVVTVPKASERLAPAPLPTPCTFPMLDSWDRDVLGEMRRMQREMDRIFDEAFSEFRAEPQFREFFDQPRFGSSVDVQEEGDMYVVRAYLPDRDMNNVNVSIEEQTLRLVANAEASDQNQDEGMVSWRKSQYSQLLTLPGPVQADKMTVERRENMLVIKVPKA
jgi:HSP20 family molecular chaperone IbpA